MLTKEQQRSIRKLINVLDAFRDECSPTMPIQQVVAYLRMVEKGGDVSQGDMSESLDMSQQAVSRIMNAFTVVNARKTQGYDLIEYYTDPFGDARLKHIRFKPKGRRFAERIATGLE